MTPELVASLVPKEASMFVMFSVRPCLVTYSITSSADLLSRVRLAVTSSLEYVPISQLGAKPSVSRVLIGWLHVILLLYF